MVSPSVPLKRIRDHILRLKNLRTLSITLTGGEPLLHPNIVDIVCYANEMIKRVGLITNGFMLNPAIIEDLNSAGLGHMQISIDGIKANKRTQKTLDKLEQKLLLLKKAKFAVNINSVIGSTDPSEAIKVIKWANEHGFRSTIGLIHDGKGQLCMDEKQRRSYLLANRIRRRPFWDVFDFEKTLIRKGCAEFKCRAGSRYLYVDEHGMVSWCSQTREYGAKRLEEYSLNDQKEQFYTRKPCARTCTIGCVRRASFLDGWRKQNQ